MGLPDVQQVACAGVSVCYPKKLDSEDATLAEARYGGFARNEDVILLTTCRFICEPRRQALTGKVLPEIYC